MRSTLPILLLAALMAPRAGAQAPSGPADALVRDYVAAFNQGEAAMRTFFEAHAAANVPADQRLARYRDIKVDMGTLTLRRIISARADAVEAEIVGGHGATGRFTFGLDGSTPPKLTGIRVEVGGPNGERQAPALPPRDEKTALADVKALVEKASSDDAFSGAVLVGRNARVVWEKAVGDADRDAHRANTTDTKFNVGSIGKAFTAVAIALLVDAHKLYLGDTVGKFLPAYPNGRVREEVTVRQLLDMQSGIGDFFGPKYEAADKTTLRTLADYLPLFADTPLRFEPGKGREYSNGGYVVLGLIIEKVSGTSYDEYLRTHVFVPAAMMSTGFFPKSQPAENRATGYTMRLGSARRSNLETLPERGSAAGGVYSTTHDLLRYADALASGRLVPLDAYAMLDLDPRGMGIAGGAPGLNATLDTAVNGYTLVVMSNYDPPSAERLAREMRNVLESVK